MDPVKSYIERVLCPSLREMGVSDEHIRYTAETVERQALSLLRRWDDVPFRKTVLLPASEEGTFYQPAGKAEVKCFVVMAVRNSPLETAQADTCRSAGLAAPLSDDAVRAITGTAVRYFSQLDFSALSRELRGSAGPDLYMDAAQRYPVAWSALRHLALTGAKVSDYPPELVAAPYELEEGPMPEPDEPQKLETLVYDAYSPKMDPRLVQLLRYIANGDGAKVLVVDSFKGVSRNFGNLMQVLEFLLTHGCAFATANYYLANGHIERRTKLLRAGHTAGQIRHNLAQTAGLGHKHTAALKSVG